jgi:hypothetical protein
LLADGYKKLCETGFAAAYRKEKAASILDDILDAAGIVESYETGNNIIRSDSGWIEVLPRPIRHSWEITVNGKPLVTVRTELTVSRVSTRLVLSLREVSPPTGGV